MSFQPKKTPAHLGCASFLLFILLPIILASRGFYHWYSIRPVLERITPGMSYDQVVAIVPNRHIRKARARSSWTPIGTCLAYSNANTRVCSRMYISSIMTPFTPDEIAYLYFDRNDLVIGIYFNSSSGNGYWKPKWVKTGK